MDVHDVPPPARGELRVSMARPPHRLDRVRAWLEEAGADLLVACGPSHVGYLTGYFRYYGGPSAAVVDRDGRRSLVVMRDEVAVAETRAAADSVVGYGERGFGIELAPLPLLADVVARIDGVQGSRLALADEFGAMAALLAERSAAADLRAEEALAQLGLVKDEDELQRILRAYELCWAGQQAVADAMARGASEIEMFSAAQTAAQVEHGEPIEFLADLLAGANTAAVCCPIHVAGASRPRAGDPVIADVVVRANGYWGDTAETHLGTEPDEAVADARSALIGILEAARIELVPGATGADVFARMAARIADAFPDGEFPHHGGHGVGLTSFDDPHVIPSDSRAFAPWMTIAVEPGVYFPGRWGARVENIFLVTPDGGIELRDAMGRPRG